MSYNETTQTYSFNVEAFVNELSTNKDMPFSQEVQFEGLRRRLGDVDDLPAPVQSVIGQIQLAGSIEEKVAIAHNFTLAYIKPEIQGMEDEFVAFPKLAQNPIGDCDDFAEFNAGLLLHGGVDPTEVFLVAGIVEYQHEGRSMLAGHGFVVVKDDDRYLLLDNNLAETPELNPENPIVRARLASNNIDTPDHLDNTLEITAEIIFLIEAIDGRGTPFLSPKANERFDSIINKTSDSSIERAASPQANELQDRPAAEYRSVPVMEL